MPLSLLLFQLCLQLRPCQTPYEQQAILTKYENLIVKKRRKDVSAKDLHIDYTAEVSGPLHGG